MGHKFGLLIAASLALSPCLAAAQNPPPRAVERDAMGRRSGTVERGPQGQAIHRDAQGRRAFSTERSPGGDTIYRDPQGRRIDPPRPERRR